MFRHSQWLLLQVACAVEEGSESGCRLVLPLGELLPQQALARSCSLTTPSSMPIYVLQRVCGMGCDEAAAAQAGLQEGGRQEGGRQEGSWRRQRRRAAGRPQVTPSPALAVQVLVRARLPFTNDHAIGGVSCCVTKARPMIVL